MGTPLVTETTGFQSVPQTPQMVTQTNQPQLAAQPMMGTSLGVTQNAQPTAFAAAYTPTMATQGLQTAPSADYTGSTTTGYVGNPVAQTAGVTSTTAVGNPVQAPGGGVSIL